MDILGNPKKKNAMIIRDHAEKRQAKRLRNQWRGGLPERMLLRIAKIHIDDEKITLAQQVLGEILEKGESDNAKLGAAKEILHNERDLIKIESRQDEQALHVPKLPDVKITIIDPDNKTKR